MLLLVALAVGGLIPIQTAANSRLRLSVSNTPVVPALVSFSTALMVAVVAASVPRGNPMPHFYHTAAVPWWGFLDGVMGVCLVLGALVVLAGIVVVLRVGKREAVETEADGLELCLVRLVGVMVGVGSAVQTAVNGYLGTIAGSSLHA